jgi:hypothetical protein
MTAPRHGAARGQGTGRAGSGNRSSRLRRVETARGTAVGGPARGSAGLSPQAQLEDLWERHGRAAYALACALLGNEAAASRAVTLAMTDLAQSGEFASGNPRRSLARHVYWRSLELVRETPRTLRLPPSMVWLGQLAQLQRACLALCLFGGHTHREAAGLLGVPSMTVAGLLTSGLKELGLLAAGGAVTEA